MTGGYVRHDAFSCVTKGAELALPLTDDELEQGHECYASMTQGHLPRFQEWCESETRDPPPADFTTTTDCGGGDWEDSDYS